MSRAVLGIAPLAMLLPGCLPELEQHRGEHVLFEHSAALEVCAGTVEYLDGLIPFLSEQIGVRTPEQIRYSWLTQSDRDQLLGSKPFEESGGLAVGYHAMSFSEPVIVHEVVHAIMGLDVTASFFQEGLAVVYDALARGQRIYEIDGSRPDPRPAMTSSTDQAADYAVAGSFVYFLIARHGPARFAEFYSGLNAPYTLTRIGAAFRRVYGIELDDEVELFMSGARPCDGEYFELLAARCVAPVQPWAGDVWTFADVLSCDALGVVGGKGNAWEVPAFRVTTLEVTETGYYDIDVVTDGALSVYIGACFGCPWRAFGGLLYDPPWTLWLAAGRYHVHVDGDPDEAARFIVTVRAADLAPGGGR